MLIRRRQARKLIIPFFWVMVAIFLLVSLRDILASPTVPNNRHAGAVVINEFMAASQTTLTDEDGEFHDWIELHNRRDTPVDLQGWSLTDDPDRPNQWMLPAITLPPDAYLLIFASGKDRTEYESEPNEGESPDYLHTNFRLDSAGGMLALYDNTSQRFLDASAYEYPDQQTDVAYGLCMHGDDCYLPVSTPGGPNDETDAIAELASPVTFSVKRGFYDRPFKVKLRTVTRNAEIRYTLDGSEPTADNGMTYSDPINIDGTTFLRAITYKPGLNPSPSVTHSYLFPEDVLGQSNGRPGFPQTWGTHRISFAGYTAGMPVTADYEVDPKIVADPEYGPQLRKSLLALPAISIVAGVDDLDIYFDDPQARGPESERPASIELIDPGGEEPGFQINSGLRIQGGAGRWEFMPKHSFRLFFRGEYGPTTLDYPLFPHSPVNKFNTLVVRAGADRSFAGHPDTENLDQNTATDDEWLRETTYARDEWLRRTQFETSGVGAHGRFVHLYLNGLYWGIYNLVQRPDAAFAAAYLGGDQNDWFTANQGGALGGRPDRFDVLRRLAAEGGLADPERYAIINEFIDPAQFSDYLIGNWYAGNRDWPQNNWYVNVQYPAGQNLFFNWDGESTWYHGAEVQLGVDDVGDTFYPNIVKPIFLALMENPDFRMTLADRLYKQTLPGAPLSDPEAKARWTDVTDEVEPGIVAESARWGDTRYEDPITLADWTDARDAVLTQMDGNAARLIELAREAGYYPSVDPPTLSHAGDTFSASFSLAMDAPVGTIYYTTDGSDPRLSVIGETSPAAIDYVEPVQINATTSVNARVRMDDGEWSALHSEIFTKAGEPTGLGFTEIMYNPLGGDEYEFIELTNFGGTEIDLAGAYFEGVNLHFGNYVTLPAGESLVIASDFENYRERYPQAPVHALYEDNLSDRGETLSLYDVRGDLLTTVKYDDENGWPLPADGLGYSLVLKEGGRDPNSPFNWRASNAVHGKPGR